MNQIEREVAKFILKYRENTEAAIIAGALARIVRKIVFMYPEGVKAELIEGMIAYLVQRDPSEGPIQEPPALTAMERLPLALSALAHRGKRRRTH